jgi:hypothetical protein
MFVHFLRFLRDLPFLGFRTLCQPVDFRPKQPKSTPMPLVTKEEAAAAGGAKVREW